MPTVPEKKGYTEHRLGSVRIETGGDIQSMKVKMNLGERGMRGGAGDKVSGENL